MAPSRLSGNTNNAPRRRALVQDLAPPCPHRSVREGMTGAQATSGGDPSACVRLYQSQRFSEAADCFRPLPEEGMLRRRPTWA